MIAPQKPQNPKTPIILKVNNLFYKMDINKFGYSIGEFIGKGNFGEVYSCTRKSDGRS